MHIYIQDTYIVTYLSADLFQSEGVLDYSSNPPTPSSLRAASTQYLPIMTSIQASKHPSIQASKHPSIPGCMDPLRLSS